MESHSRILSSLVNGPARRNLFGPVDREQLRAEYQAALRKDLEEASKRWGYDFISDKPLDSSEFQWEDVSGTKVPLLYRSCMLGLSKMGGQRSASTPKAAKLGSSPHVGKENIPRKQERSAALELEKLEKTPQRNRENRGLKRKQTNITDFYQAKKRVVWMPCKSRE